MAASSQRAQVQVEDPNLISIQPIEVTKGDAYVRPAQVTEAQASVPLADFLQKMSPTLMAGQLRKQEANDEMEAAKLVESYTPKTVKNFNAIFKDKESYKKYAEDFNHLTLTAQINLGSLIANKYADDTKMAIQQRAINENWGSKTPEEFKIKVEEANSAALADIAKNNPSALQTPKFVSTFSTELEKHGNGLINSHIPAYGQYMAEMQKSQIQDLTLTAVKNRKNDDFNAVSADVMKTVEFNLPTANSLDISKNVVGGIIASGDIKYMEAIINGDTKLVTKDGTNIGKSALANKAFSDAVVAKKNENTSAMQAAQAAYGGRQAMAKAFINIGINGGGRADYAGLATYQKKNGVEGPTVSPGEFTALYKQEQKAHYNLFPPTQKAMLGYSIEAERIATSGGDKAVADYVDSIRISDEDRAIMLRNARNSAGVKTSEVFQGSMENCRIYFQDATTGSGQSSKDAQLRELGVKKNMYEFSKQLSAGSKEKSPVWAVLTPEEKASVTALTSKGNNIIGVGYNDVAPLSQIIFDASLRQQDKVAPVVKLTPQAEGKQAVKVVIPKNPNVGLKSMTYEEYITGQSRVITGERKGN